MSAMFSEERSIDCPYCGESITILVDPSVIPQSYIEDCQVCCQPIEIGITESFDGGIAVAARTQDEC